MEAIVEETPAASPEPSDRKPSVVVILAILYIVIGVISLGFVARQGPTIDVEGSDRGVFFMMMALYPAIGLAAGVGMWLGRRWGWWLGLFGVVSMALRNLWAIAGLPGMLAAMGVPLSSATMLYAKFGIRVLLSVLVAIYFLSNTVVGYFRVEKVRKRRALAIVAAISVLLIAAGEMLGMLQ